MNELMVNPTKIEIGQNKKTRNLYESFYFRGNLQNTGYSFWLKHNLIGFNNDSNIRIDNALILFDEDRSLTQVYQQSTNIDFNLFQQKYLQEDISWRKIKFEFASSGFCQLDFENENVFLKGKIADKEGPVEWDLKLTLSQISYYHFDKKWFYHCFFPKKKILTADCFVQYSGKISSKFLNCQGFFLGMNGHNWGKEHAYQYAYANCNQWTNEQNNSEKIYFDCFSAKILIAQLKTPYLSAASLFYKNNWFHFNKVMCSWRHLVHNLELKKYCVTFLNDDYKLELEINGEGHAWVTLDYDHPSRKISKVNNTKHATGSIKLTRLKDLSLVVNLLTSSFELETLLAK